MHTSAPRLLFIAGSGTTYHHIQSIRVLLERSSKEGYFMTEDRDIADIARDILSVDRVLLIPRMKILFFKKPLSIRERIYDIDPHGIIYMGELSPSIGKETLFLSIPTVWIQTDSTYHLPKGISVEKKIYSSLVSRTGMHSSEVFIPNPMVDYQDFLDFDTSKVLQMKQNLGIIQYKDGIITKSMVACFGGAQKVYPRVRHYIRNAGFHSVSLENLETSDLDLPDIEEENAPLIYELFDALVIVGGMNERFSQSIMWAMASGTVLVLPRTPEWLSIAGKGALYYQSNSLRELQACLEIIQKSEQRRQEKRAIAFQLFEKLYSYQAIARLWDKVISSVIQ